MEPLQLTRLNSYDEDFSERFAALLRWHDSEMVDIERRVADILTQVREEGDAALLRLTQRYDRVTLTPDQLAFSREEMAAACAQTAEAEYRALRHAAGRIRAYHAWQMPAMGISWYRDPIGMALGQRLQPLHRVGLYVPGGLASYPSSVLMNAIPAQVAGVADLVMVVPTPDYYINPMVLAAAYISGVDTVYRVGGAQAVAALAYGTETVPRVDKIVGPGNVFVATAKRQLFGQVGIDMIAGPSEILVIADRESNPDWVAADLLAQAEHDASAQSILMTDSHDLARAVEESLARLLPTLSREAICRKALASRGAIVMVRNLREACRLASQAAPEHLVLCVESPHALLPWIHHAGAIFLGRHVPEAVGDYVAGPNHVLPTGGTARFSSPLGVYDFIKRTSLLGCDADVLQKVGPAAACLAQGEGLTAHQRSIEVRMKAY